MTGFPTPTYQDFKNFRVEFQQNHPVVGIKYVYGAWFWLNLFPCSQLQISPLLVGQMNGQTAKASLHALQSSKSNLPAVLPGCCHWESRIALFEVTSSQSPLCGHLNRILLWWDHNIVGERHDYTLSVIGWNQFSKLNLREWCKMAE